MVGKKRGLGLVIKLVKRNVWKKFRLAATQDINGFFVITYFNFGGWPVVKLSDFFTIISSVQRIHSSICVNYVH